jgi:glycosyltransferase involved in cell wall biosynthesis
VLDVEGWAWDIKTQYLKRYLDEYYDIDIAYTSYKKDKIDKNKYDLLFSYGFAFTHYITNKKNKEKCVTGVTAHRKKIQVVKPMQQTKWHHANSVLLYNELKSWGVENVFYVPNGVDTNFFKPLKPLCHYRPYIIFGHVGKKSPNKNQASFLEPVIKESNAFFVPHYNTFLNKIPHKDMINIYQKFDVYIASSTEDGTPNGMLESAACGRPIIINKIGNGPELIKNEYNGFCIDMDKSQYENVIRWCLNNKEKVIKMGENAREEIKKWDWSLMSKNYLLMFDKILGIKRDKEIYENPSLYHIKGYKERWDI